jgi:glycosyl transferase family 25
MKVNKYLISIQQKGDPRYDQFFSHAQFNEEEFKVFGVIGANLPTRDYFNLGVKNKTRPLTPAELGCTLSHLKAIEDFVNSDADYAYIFEDDVKLKVDFNFEQYLSFLGNGFILSLGGISLYICKNVKGKLSGSFFGKPLLCVDKNFYDCIFYAMGYVLDKTAATRLLEFHKTVSVIDHWSLLLARYPELKYYMCDLLDHPEVSVINQTNSDIEHERQGHATMDMKPRLIRLLTLYFSYRFFKYKKKIMKLFLTSYPDHKI